MKKQGIKVIFIRILLVLSLVAILVIAVIRGRNTSATSSQPQSVCDGCPSRTECEQVQPPVDTTKSIKDTLCIRNTK